jgi:uncharacterized protein (TIRG00374 family)
LIISKNYRWILAIFLILISYFYIDWRALKDAFSTKHVEALLISQPIQFLLIFIASWRLAILIQNNCNKILIFFQAYILSIGFNSFLPGRISELVKVTFLKEWLNIPVTNSSVGVIVERLIDLLILIGLVLLGFGSLWIDANNFLFASLFGLIILFLIFISFYSDLIFRFINILPFKKFNGNIRNIVLKFKETIRNEGFTLALIISVFLWVGSYLMLLLILKIIYGAEISINDTLIIFSAMSLGRAIPGLPGGIGIYEAAIVLAMEYLGFGFSESLATAITIHVSQIFFVTLLSLVLFGRKGIGLSFFIKKIKRK